MKLSLRETSTLILILLISLGGALAIYSSTHWGPWAFSDSTEYIVSARSLLAGQGLGYPAPSGEFIPYTLHPPFYPLVLSAVGLLGFDLLQVARWLNIVLFGATIFASGAFTYIIFQSSWLALSISLALLTLPDFVDISSGAMTEPLLLFTAALSICLLILYLHQKRVYLLVLSAIAAGLAAISRYPGVVVTVVCLLGLLALGKSSWKRRLQDVLVFALLSLTPIVLWLAWIYRQARSVGARGYQIPSDLWANTIALRKQLMEVLWSWLPFKEYLGYYSYNRGRFLLILVCAAILVLVSLIIFQNLRHRGSQPGSFLGFSFALLWILFILGNLALLSVTYLFTLPTPDINPRTLLPVQVGLVFVLLTLTAVVIKEFHLPDAVGWVCLGLVAIFIFPNGQTSWRLVNQYHQYGQGYTNSAWYGSLTLRTLRDLPANIPLITNQAAAVLFLLNRPAYEFCTLPCNQSDQITYGDDLQDPVQRVFRQEGAALVLFYPYCGVQSAAWYSSTQAQLNQLTQGLRRAFSSCDGAIYYYPLP